MIVILMVRFVVVIIKDRLFIHDFHVRHCVREIRDIDNFNTTWTQTNTII
jgi:hypothetical protein